MHSENTQRLVAWEPTDFNGRTPSFGDIVICSPQSQQLSVTLPFEEGDLRIEFKNARAFMSSWDGDPNPFLTFEEAASRPSDLLKVENSRWLVRASPWMSKVRSKPQMRLGRISGSYPVSALFMLLLAMRFS